MKRLFLLTLIISIISLGWMISCSDEIITGGDTIVINNFPNDSIEFVSPRDLDTVAGTIDFVIALTPDSRPSIIRIIYTNTLAVVGTFLYHDSIGATFRVSHSVFINVPSYMLFPQMITVNNDTIGGRVIRVYR